MEKNNNSNKLWIKIIVPIASLCVIASSILYIYNYKINKEKIISNNNTKVLSGDINLDGKVNGQDLIRLTKYLNNEVGFNEEQKTNADLNQDGKIDEQDSEILKKHLAGDKEFETLPYKGTISNELLYGDVNLDGSVSTKDFALLKQYIDNKATLSEEAKKNADVNEDGKLDQTDVDIIMKHLAGDKGYETLPYKGTMPTETSEEKPKELIFGDVNLDGSVSTKDFALLKQYIDNKATLSEEAKKNADVNEDGKLDQTDVNIIMKHLAGDKGYETLPYKGTISKVTLYGDVNLDGSVSTKDFALLKQYIDNKATLSEEAKKNADVNEDGKLDQTDVDIIMKHLAKDKGYETLPYKG